MKQWFLVEDQKLRSKEKPSMKIIGCDFHPSWQQAAVFDAETGEVTERKLINGDGEAERFYGALPAPASRLRR